MDEEIKRALLGVKQVREMMEKKEEKHRHLMDGLRHSSDKKKVKHVGVTGINKANIFCVLLQSFFTDHEAVWLNSYMPVFAYL